MANNSSLTWVVFIALWTLIMCELVTCLDVTSRDLLAQKQTHLKNVKESIAEVEILIKADEYFPLDKMSGYSESKKNVLSELTSVLKNVQYEVDILSRLCLDKKGPNCDNKVEQAGSNVVTMKPSSISFDNLKYEMIKGAVDSENIVVDGRLPDGSAAKTCKEYLKLNPNLGNGVYFIKPFSDESEFKVFCDMKNGGYINFQRRIDGAVDFYRKWKDYAEGFGDEKTSYWLGLNRVSKFTQQYSNTSLRVDLYHDTLKKSFYATYSKFSVEPESKDFTLHVGGYNGTLGNSMSYHDNRKFTTQDRDNDEYESNCAVTFKGAFWYGRCHSVNLNGAYLKGKHSSYADGMEWYDHSGHYYSFEKSSMSIIE